MKLFRRGCGEAGDFERVALVHLEELVRTATRTSGTREVAEDLVQETYLRAWKYWDRFELGTNCRAWLYTILFNVIRRRRGGFDPNTVSIEAPELASVLPFAPPPSINASAVEAAFEKLPEDYRAVLILVAVEGFAYKEAAEILDVPIGTVMSRLHRGREALRGLLDGPRSRPKDDASASARRAQ